MGRVAVTRTYELRNGAGDRALVDVRLDAHGSIIGVSLKTREDQSAMGRWSPPWARVGESVEVWPLEVWDDGISAP